MQYFTTLYRLTNSLFHSGIFSSTGDKMHALQVTFTVGTVCSQQSNEKSQRVELSSDDCVEERTLLSQSLREDRESSALMVIFGLPSSQKAASCPCTWPVTPWTGAQCVPSSAWPASKAHLVEDMGDISLCVQVQGM